MADLNDADPAKLAAARAAVALVEDGMKLGLGTGSTASVMVQVLAERVKAEGLRLRCAATSQATADLATSLGLSIETLDQIGRLDMTIDGADEIDPDLNLIKGGGGAHLREKIVASSSDRMVVIADGGKVVERLGLFHLPVEVLEFGLQGTTARIKAALDEIGLDGRPILLRKRDDQPFITDEGNLILDLSLEAIPDAALVNRTLNALPGVVENGLFIGLCDQAFVGRDDGTVVELHHDDIEDEIEPLFGSTGEAN
ncbi:ribose-5-phosphate isomerase RpiA [Paracoccus sp. TK19116]|uniref:Ribose-5-phosphate isomerase A n=1 Tax=Paracoccus albicereus TaxID=2922394 RepID=A0ABT1MQ64_9RHOB|nr:ribose-5-phosphate isomerase RpiA [Paracoccus albicereus]MCQ0969844.1 ribose-5-phosphate isomerase RpiA [Paracoccus albicereus]